MSNQTFATIIQNAQAAFWASLSAQLPCKSGDLPPEIEMEFSEVTRRAALKWAEINLPDGTAIQTEDGYTFRKINGVFTDGDMEFGDGLDQLPDFCLVDIPDPVVRPTRPRP